MTKKTESKDQGEAVAGKRRKRAVVLGVVAAVVVVAGAGMFVWHEQPSFCGAICHWPMSEYVETFDQKAGQAGVDKWGNAVADTDSMMAVKHASLGKDCLSCHVPTLGEQVSEGMSWVAGDYVYPLEERSLEELTAARGLDDEEFCLNENCHDLTREELTEKTSDREFNPHVVQHEELACGDCHKAHRASVYRCAECHDVDMPEGWITPAEESKLENWYE